MHSVSPTGCSARFVTNYETTTFGTRKLLPLHIASQANYHIEIGFGQRIGDGACVSRAVNKQIAIFEKVSLGKAICVPILLPVSR